jgi:hypothetical protein
MRVSVYPAVAYNSSMGLISKDYVDWRLQTLNQDFHELSRRNNDVGFKMVANVLIALSAAVALLALLDLFMSEKQKDGLSDWVTVAWNYLDNLLAFSLADWFKHPRAALWHAVNFALFGTPIYILFISMSDRKSLGSSYNGQEEFGFAVLFFLTFAPPVMFLSYIFFRKILATVYGEKFWKNILGLFAFYAVVAALAALLLAVDKYFLTTHGDNLGFLPLFVLRLANFVLNSFRSFSVASIAFVLAIIASIALAYAITGVLFAGEFVVRRIAEYPKGPILALSTIFASAIALIKTLF